MEDVGAGTAAANFTGSVGGGSFATTAAACNGGDGGDGGASGSSGGLTNASFFKSLMSIPGAIAGGTTALALV